MLPALPLVVLVPAHSRAAVWAGQGRPEPAAEKSVSYWEHSWNWSSCSSLPLSLTYFWRDWAVEEEWIFCVCVFSLLLDFPKTDFGRQWLGGDASHMLSGFGGVWKRGGRRKRSCPSALTGNCQPGESSSWAAELCHSVQISSIAAKALFCPFQLFISLPPWQPRGAAFFCLCKPKRQCGHWLSCCFRNASYKIVISKISFILFCFGDRKVCLCMYRFRFLLCFFYVLFFLSYRKDCFGKVVFKSELPWQWKPEAYQHACCKVNGAADAGLSFILRSAPPHEVRVSICHLWVSLLQFEFREEFEEKIDFGREVVLI